MPLEGQSVMWMPSDLVAKRMVTALNAHPWVNPTPAEIKLGRVLPGDLDRPSIGVVYEPGSGGRGTLVSELSTETLRWQFGMPLGLGDSEDGYRTLLGYRDEMRTVAREANDGRWGMGSVVARSKVEDWRSRLFTEPTMVQSVELSVAVDLEEAPAGSTLPIHVESMTLNLGGEILFLKHANLTAWGRVAIRLRRASDGAVLEEM